MLFALLDNRERTSTELAIVAGVTPSTASSHLNRLHEAALVRVHVQGRHRYYGLRGDSVARALETLSALAGDETKLFRPTTPDRLQRARTCYDHIAGTLGVTLYDRVWALGWLEGDPGGDQPAYDLTDLGATALRRLGGDPDSLRRSRRRLAFDCLDWSERRPHLAGALGAELLRLMLAKGWATKSRVDRALHVTPLGRRELGQRFGIVW